MSVVELTNQLIENLQQSGYPVVAGVDEVGRGCLAGPVTAAAVILPSGQQITGARDSKLLSSTKRLQLSQQIRQQALAVGLGWASASEVDRLGLTQAVQLSGIRALQNMQNQYDAVILDGKHNYLDGHCYAQAVVKADQTCLSVACASIVAKVARDRYMDLMHRRYPAYGFDQHKGYGTAAHRQALKAGLSPLHRRSFAGLALMGVANVD